MKSTLRNKFKMNCNVSNSYFIASVKRRGTNQMKKLFCLSFFIVLLNHCILEIAYADKRDREKTARQAINTLLQSIGKDKYEVNDIADIELRR
jgi:hypothetical protein